MPTIALQIAGLIIAIIIVIVAAKNIYDDYRKTKDVENMKDTGNDLEFYLNELARITDYKERATETRRLAVNLRGLGKKTVSNALFNKAIAMMFVEEQDGAPMNIVFQTKMETEQDETITDQMTDKPKRKDWRHVKVNARQKAREAKHAEREAKLAEKNRKKKLKAEKALKLARETIRRLDGKKRTYTHRKTGTWMTPAREEYLRKLKTGELTRGTRGSKKVETTYTGDQEINS